MLPSELPSENGSTLKGKNFLPSELPSEKGSTLNEKNLHPKGANSFHFGVDPFSERDETILLELLTLEVELFTLALIRGQRCPRSDCVNARGYQCHSIHLVL